MGASGGTTISSGTYNNATGQVALTLAASTVVPVGGTVTIAGATGTGAFASINGAQTLTATTGTTVTFSIASGLGATTITGGSANSGTVTLALAPSPAVQTVGVLTTGTTVRYRVAWWPGGHPLLGDTVAAAGFGNSAYNITGVVTAVNPFYVEIASTVTGSPGTLGTVQPTSAWTSEMPLPAFGNSAGFINVTGTPSCSRCRVTGATTNSISFASATTTGFVNGTVQFAHSGDWSGLPPLEANFYAGTIYGGDRIDAFLATNFPYVQEYAPAADVTGGIGHTYQIGGAATPFTQSFTDTGFTMGASSGVSIYNFGMEGSPGGIGEDGAGHLFLREAGATAWEVLPGLVPTIDGLAAPGRNVGTPSLRPYFLYSHFENIAPSTVAQLSTNDPSPSDGDKAYVTDAVSCATFNAAVTGGGSGHCPVHYNATTSAWTAG
jgi:hypothetical protein